MITTILIFIIVLGVLVLVHEFGHFITAKRTGMRVEEFGFGFPPRLAGIRKAGGKWKVVWGNKNPSSQPPSASSGNTAGAKEEAGTVYSINWIPFGGFVRIMGENNEKAEDPQSFVNKPIWARFLTLIAGVSMNWILAALLFSLTFMVGITTEIVPDDPVFRNAVITNQQPAISYVAEGQPAQKAGLAAGDIILRLDGEKFTDVSQVQEYIRANKGKNIRFTVQRLNEEKDVQVESQANPKEGEGPTGIGLAQVGKVKMPFIQSIGLGIGKAASMTVVIVQGVGQLFTSKEVLNSVGGPLKIAQLTGQVADLGLVALMNFTGLLSINLAILNILPFPALDGGRVLFLLIEKIRRKRNNQYLEQVVNTAGFLLLISLMIVVTIKDVRGFGGLGRIVQRLFGQ